MEGSWEPRRLDVGRWSAAHDDVIQDILFTAVMAIVMESQQITGSGM